MNPAVFQIHLLLYTLLEGLWLYKHLILYLAQGYIHWYIFGIVDRTLAFMLIFSHITSSISVGKEDFLRMDILEEFREFFEDEKYMKCWHNYGFDRHVMANPPLNIHCKGFAGDTMHMARLWDSSRKLKGYSLESLSTDKQV